MFSSLLGCHLTSRRPDASNRGRPPDVHQASRHRVGEILPTTVRSVRAPDVGRSAPTGGQLDERDRMRVGTWAFREAPRQVTQQVRGPSKRPAHPVRAALEKLATALGPQKALLYDTFLLGWSRGPSQPPDLRPRHLHRGGGSASWASRTSRSCPLKLGRRPRS